MNVDTKEGLVKFIMSAVKKYPETEPQPLNPVVYHSSYMMSIDKIKNALPGKHKETFKKEIASALFNYRRHFKLNGNTPGYTYEYYSSLSSRIQSVLSKVWFEMSDDSKKNYLSKLTNKVLNEIRLSYFDSWFHINRNITFDKNRYNLMKKLIVEKEVMPLTKKAKDNGNARIKALLMSLKRRYRNGQIGQAMYTTRGGLRKAAINEANQKKIKNTRKNLMANIQANSTNARLKQKWTRKKWEEFKRLNPNYNNMDPENIIESTKEMVLKAIAENTKSYEMINNIRKKLLPEIKEGVHGKNHMSLNYTSPMKPSGRPIPGYRNNTGAYYPRNKNAVSAGNETIWRNK